MLKIKSRPTQIVMRRKKGKTKKSYSTLKQHWKQYIPEEDRKTYETKHHVKNNKDDDMLNNENTSAQNEISWQFRKFQEYTTENIF